MDKLFMLRFVLQHRGTEEYMVIYSDLYHDDSSVARISVDKEYSIVRIDRAVGRKDESGKELYENDTVQLLNWGDSKGQVLGVAVLQMDPDEGCWNTEPMVIEDQYDFYTKCSFSFVEIAGVDSSVKDI